MSWEWDPGKAKANFAKHRVSFADAVTVLEDDLALTMPDLYADDEERWVTLGRDALGRLLVVIYTWRGDLVRRISARQATARELQQYEENHET